MKTIYQYLLFALVIFIAGCGEETPLDTTDKENFIASIAHTWAIDAGSYIQINNQDVTGLFEGFEITINDDLSYTSNSDQLTITEFPWTTSGSFELNDELTTLTRDDGLVIELNLMDSDDSLELSFENEDHSAARLAGIIGGWKCKFKKKP